MCSGRHCLDKHHKPESNSNLKWKMDEKAGIQRRGRSDERSPTLDNLRDLSTANAMHRYTSDADLLLRAS